MDKYTIKNDDIDEDLKLVVSLDDGYPRIVHAKGELDFYTKSKLMSIVESLFAQNEYKIVLDLKDIAFIDSSGLSFLVLSQRLVESHSGKLGCVLSDAVLRVLKLAGLDQLFNIYPSVSSARKDFE